MSGSDGEGEALSSVVPISRCVRRQPAKSFVGQFEANAALLGDMRLYSWLTSDASDEATLTYSEMRARAAAVCVALRRKWGAQDADRAMLIYQPSLDLLVGFFGCQYAAVIAVPYYPPVIPMSPIPSVGAKRLLADGLIKVKRIASSCDPVVFLSSKSYIRASWLASKLIRDADCAWPNEWVWHATDELSFKLSVADAAWLDAWLPHRMEPAPHTEICFLQYTSGSTGQPKGVSIGTRNLLSNVMAMSTCNPATGHNPPPGSNVVMVSWLPQYHDFGLIAGSLSTAVQGYRSDLMSPFTFIKHPMAWLQGISRLHATHVVISPSPNFGYALATRRCKPQHLGSLRLSHWVAAFNGAEPIRPKTLSDFDAKFGPCGWDSAAWACLYGLAETCVYGCGVAEAPVVLKVARGRLGPGDAAMPAGGEEDDDLLEVAGCYVLPPEVTGQHFAVSHPDTNEALPDGIVGEVRISGLSVARGYYRLPELSAQTFKQPLGPSSAKLKPLLANGKPSPAGIELAAPDGGDQASQPAAYLCTGDLGFLWEKRLYIVGRIKDILCIRGRTLHAHDVETCAEAAHPALRPGCVAAFPVTPDDGDEALVIVAEMKPEAAADADSLARVIDQVIRGVRDGEGVKPHAILLLKPRTILKTTSGKLRRRELRVAYAQIDTLADSGALAPGVAPHAPPPAANTGWGLRPARVAPVEAAARNNPLIALDAVLRYWKDTGPSHQSAQDPPSPPAEVPGAAQQAETPPPAAPATAAAQAAASAAEEKDESGQPASFSGMSGSSLCQAERVLGYSYCDTESPADMAWAMRSSYAIAWGFTIAQTASALQAEGLRDAQRSPTSDASPHGNSVQLSAAAADGRASGASANDSAPGGTVALNESAAPAASACSSVVSTSPGEGSNRFGECPVEGLEVLLTGCRLTPHLPEAAAWFDEQGLDSVAEMRKVGMESAFVDALGLKPGKAKSLLLDIADFF